MKGLILEGGGTKGAYQIGAYKALRDLGIEFQGVAGTSIGALNGAYICLLYTSPSPRDRTRSRMPSSA